MTLGRDWIILNDKKVEESKVTDGLRLSEIGSRYRQTKLAINYKNKTSVSPELKWAIFRTLVVFVVYSPFM